MNASCLKGVHSRVSTTEVGFTTLFRAGSKINDTSWSFHLDYQCVPRMSLSEMAQSVFSAFLRPAVSSTNRKGCPRVVAMVGKRPSRSQPHATFSVSLAFRDAQLVNVQSDSAAAIHTHDPMATRGYGVSTTPRLRQSAPLGKFDCRSDGTSRLGCSASGAGSAYRATSNGRWSHTYGPKNEYSLLDIRRAGVVLT